MAVNNRITVIGIKEITIDIIDIRIEIIGITEIGEMGETEEKEIRADTMVFL